MTPLSNRTRPGKLIKNDDNLLEKVELVEYSFKELVPMETIEYDNISSSIIHTRLHGDQDLKVISKPLETFNNILIDNQNRQHIIMPRDFTDDWHKQRMRNKKSEKDQDEDDDFDLDLESFEKAENSESREKGQTDHEKRNEDFAHHQEQSAPNPEIQPDVPSQLENEHENRQLAELKQEPGDQDDGMEMVGNAIKSINAKNEEIRPPE